MSKRLIECYNTFLPALSMTAAPTGEISLINPETKIKEPVEVKGRRLILPTRDFLRKEDRSDYQPFHPLSENLARGQSVVMKNLVNTVRKLILWNLFELSIVFMEVACTAEYQKNLPSIWNKFFVDTKDADAKTLENFKRILKAGCDEHKRFASVFLKNGGKIGNDKFSRVCHIGFTWFDDIDSQLVFGIKIRKKDVDVIKAVMRWVLPGIDTADYYSAGTNANVAPYFVALMSAWGKVAKDFNNAIAMASVVETPASTIPLDYLDHMDELSSMYRDIPPLEGNEGAPVRPAEPKPAVNAIPARETPPWNTNDPEPRPAPVQHRPQAQPAQAQQPAQGKSGDFRAPLGQMGYPQQPMYAQQPMPGYGMPPQGYQQPQPQYNPYAQQPQMQPQGGIGATMNQVPNMYANQMQMGMMNGYQQPMQQNMYAQPQNMYAQQPQPNYGMQQNVPGYGVPMSNMQNQYTL